MEPLVSVIIPNYNHAPFLKARIDSVLSQSYDNFEVIILDDCSKDDSAAVIEQYRNHPKISHIVYNTENSGSTFKQWHKGFDLAKGEYIWIAESDDVAHPDFLKRLISEINGDKDVTLAASGITVIDENGNKIGSLSISKSIQPRKYTGKQFIRENMLIGNHLFNASSAIIRKDALKSIPDAYTKLKSSGDYLFWVELANLGKVVEIPDKLDYFRKYSTSVTPRLYASGQAFMEALLIFNRLKELGFTKGLYHNIIVGFRLNQIRRNPKFNSEEIRNNCLDVWQQESQSESVDKAIYMMYGAYRRLVRFICNYI